MNTNGPNTSGMNAGDRIEAQSHKDPEQLEREIDHQRDHIGEIVHALEERMSPGQIFERVLRTSKDGGSEFASNLGRTIKANPMPTLLTAAGMLWLYSGHDQRNPDRQRHSTQYSTSDFPSYGDHDRDHDSGPGIGERAHDLREGAAEKWNSAKQRVGEKAHSAGDSVRDRAHRANSGLHHMLDDNPMAVGAMAIAVGALLGAMLPSSRTEDELLGETSDRVKEKAKKVARDGREKVAEAGHEVTDSSSGSSPFSSSGGTSTSGTTTGATTSGGRTVTGTSGTSAGTGLTGVYGGTNTTSGNPGGSTPPSSIPPI